MAKQTRITVTVTIYLDRAPTSDAQSVSWCNLVKNNLKTALHNFASLWPSPSNPNNVKITRFEMSSVQAQVSDQ